MISSMAVNINRMVTDRPITRTILHNSDNQNTTTSDLAEKDTVVVRVKDSEIPPVVDGVGDLTVGDQDHSLCHNSESSENDFIFLQEDVVDVAKENVLDVHEFIVHEDLGAGNVEYSFLQDDMVNPAFVEVSSRKYLTSNAKRTNFNKMEVRKYTADVKRFCGDCTETTDSELNRIRKYWVQRYLLYTRFDAGILLDHESFYSVCPEILARHIAERYCRFPNGVAVDPFCGAGGNVIQLAKTCGKVIAMDIDGSKIKLARHNARIYGCDNIEFRQNDYFHGPIVRRADVVVTSPPWGGPEYLSRDVYSPSIPCEAHGGGEAIVLIARAMAPKLALHLPRTVDKSECVAIAKKLCYTRIKFEENYICDRHNSTTVFFSY